MRPKRPVNHSKKTKIMKWIFLLPSLAFVLILSACSEDNNESAIGLITLEFDNVVGATNLKLNTADAPYTNSKGEPFSVTWLTYYVSNIKLKRSDGVVYEDPVSPDGSRGYYLVDEKSAESQEITLKNVPAGEYSEVTFTIGVDAGQVNQAAQRGALDPANGLFWSWNSGYISMALEGVSASSTEADDVFQFHVGGYKDDVATNQVNNIRTITLGFNG